MDVKLYVSSIPNSEKLTSLEFSTFNLVLMSAICEVYNNNKLSQLAHINRNSINSAWGKNVCDRTFKQLQSFNPNSYQVKKNIYDFIFFMQNTGSPLKTFYIKERKCLNYPLILDSLLNPKFDFSNSELLQYLTKEVDRLKRNYDNTNKPEDFQQQ